MCVQPSIYAHPLDKHAKSSIVDFPTIWQQGLKSIPGGIYSQTQKPSED